MAAIPLRVEQTTNAFHTSYTIARTKGRVRLLAVAAAHLTQCADTVDNGHGVRHVAVLCAASRAFSAAIIRLEMGNGRPPASITT